MAVSLSLLSKKVTGMLLGIPKSIKGGLKLAGSGFVAGKAIDWAKEQSICLNIHCKCCIKWSN